ncbi:hypothetical protein BH09ACT7_BH09ACT7_34510 [soil metagenome]
MSHVRPYSLKCQFPEFLPTRSSNTPATSTKLRLITSRRAAAPAGSGAGGRRAGWRRCRPLSVTSPYLRRGSQTASRRDRESGSKAQAPQADPSPASAGTSTSLFPATAGPDLRASTGCPASVCHPALPGSGRAARWTPSSIHPGWVHQEPVVSALKPVLIRAAAAAAAAAVSAPARSSDPAAAGPADAAESPVRSRMSYPESGHRAAAASRLEHHPNHREPGHRAAAASPPEHHPNHREPGHQAAAASPPEHHPNHREPEHQATAASPPEHHPHHREPEHQATAASPPEHHPHRQEPVRRATADWVTRCRRDRRAAVRQVPAGC